MDAYSEGFKARLQDRSIHENPYPVWASSWPEWQNGWKAQNEHLADREEVLASLGWQRI